MPSRYENKSEIKETMVIYPGVIKTRIQNYITCNMWQSLVDVELNFKTIYSNLRKVTFEEYLSYETYNVCCNETLIKHMETKFKFGNKAKLRLRTYKRKLL